jgi:hypothetical protein
MGDFYIFLNSYRLFDITSFEMFLPLNVWDVFIAWLELVSLLSVQKEKKYELLIYLELLLVLGELLYEF